MPSLHELGWNSFFQQQLEQSSANAIPVRVAEMHRTYCVVWSESGESEIEVGVLPDRQATAVGDWLLLASESERPLQRLARKTSVVRKAWGNTVDEQIIAANIDTLFVVTACDAEFNESRIERYLALAAAAGIPAVIVLTKIDLAPSFPAFLHRAEQISSQIPVVAVDATEASSLESLMPWCVAGQTIALLGSSGVGKSTLTNGLAHAEQKTGAVREDDRKGRHTTTTRSLHRLKAGGLILDTPGMRELQLSDVGEGIEETFADVLELMTQCKFRNCGHDEEPGCAVNAALASGELEQRRWDSYNKLVTEQAALAETIARRREKGRNLAREVAAAKANKQARKRS